jgi:hypothetical protein
MNVSSDIVNNSCVINGVINNNKFKKLTWTYHRKVDNEIAKCHDVTSKITSIKFSNHEGIDRVYFYSKEDVDYFKVNYYLKNDILVGTSYVNVDFKFTSWIEYKFDDEFKFELYE